MAIGCLNTTKQLSDSIAKFENFIAIEEKKPANEQRKDFILACRVHIAGNIFFLPFAIDAPNVKVRGCAHHETLTKE